MGNKHKPHTNKPQHTEQEDINESLDLEIESEASDDLATEESDQVDIEQNTLETLKKQLADLKQKADYNFDLAARAKAELDNVRKRTELEVSNAHRYALEKFVPELFPLLDGLDQGLNTLPNDEQYNGVRDGLNLSLKMFRDMLVKFGVEILNPENEVFNPAKHEAIAIQPSADVAPGTVLAVVQKGYVLNNRVLRPARVVVSKE